MPTVAMRPVRRQRPLKLTAGQRALMRWYPAAPLRSIDALRTQRPAYPLIQGGKADDHAVASFSAGGHAA